MVNKRRPFFPKRLLRRPSLLKGDPFWNTDNDATEDEMLAGKAFIDAVSRGGLIKPSDLLHVVCMHASDDLFRYIRKDLLSSVNPRTLFVEVLKTKMEEQDSTNQNPGC